MKGILLLLGLVLGQAPEPPVPLEVKGTGVRAVILVTAFPFTINAPSGSALYFWQFPASVTAVDKGETLEVLSAPKGTVVVSVKAVTADWDAKKFITKFGQVTFAVGEVPGPGPDPGPGPGPGPGPDPTPKTELDRAFEAAWVKETGTNRLANKSTLAALYKRLADRLDQLPAQTTLGALLTSISTERKSLIGDDLLYIRTALALHLQAIPALANPDTQLGFAGSATRAAVVANFRAAAASLEKLK
jgi:hypothetical protein